MKSICKIFLQMGAILRNESNAPKKIVIGYSNHPLIVRSKISLDSSREVAQGCEVSFVNYFYLIFLIVGQSLCQTATDQTKQGPRP